MKRIARASHHRLEDRLIERIDPRPMPAPRPRPVPTLRVTMAELLAKKEAS